MGNPKPKKTRDEINKEFVQSLASLQESLASLRVIVNYMQLDLEATRREKKKAKWDLEAMERRNKTLEDRLAKYEGDSQSKD